MRIAIIGSGISGLTAAHVLAPGHDVHLFEADARPGGHAHTVPVDLPEGTVQADTGFLVYNERTYPLFTRLLAELGVTTKPSEMSFSLSDDRHGLEWRGTSLATVFAQRANALRPAFLAMLRDVARFNRMARRMLNEPDDDPGSLRDLLSRRRWSRGFMDWYLVPLGSAIWSADPQTFTEIPARTFVEFFARHGLLGAGDQPEWRTVCGGSQTYVQSILEPLIRRGRLHLATPVTKVRRSASEVELLTASGPTAFDHVIMATHSDQALGLLGDATADERAVLGAIRYQPNRTTLHTDERLLPANRRAWAAWNYRRSVHQEARPTLTYYLNRLQGLAVTQPVLVTLNSDHEIDPDRIVRQIDYEHPIIDGAAVRAQARQLSVGGPRVSFCGAYWGYGFHEDGVRSALAACDRLGARW